MDEEIEETREGKPEEKEYESKRHKEVVIKKKEKKAREEKSGETEGENLIKLLWLKRKLPRN